MSEDWQAEKQGLDEWRRDWRKLKARANAESAKPTLVERIREVLEKDAEKEA